MNDGLIRGFIYSYYLVIRQNWITLKSNGTGLKKLVLAGQMFEDEYELSMAVRSAIESRQARNGLVVKRYHFIKEKI